MDPVDYNALHEQHASIRQIEEKVDQLIDGADQIEEMQKCKNDPAKAIRKLAIEFDAFLTDGPLEQIQFALDEVVTFNTLRAILDDQVLSKIAMHPPQPYVALTADLHDYLRDKNLLPVLAVYRGLRNCRFENKFVPPVAHLARYMCDQKEHLKHVQRQITHLQSQIKRMKAKK